jgi:Xaa-Pro aminopeptidase
VKDEDELDAIRRAAAIVTIAFERFADQGDVVGQKERDLAWRFEQFLHEANAEGLSFPAHISSGPNSAKPHAHPGERRVERDELLLIDAGCIVDGYCSDCTRTWATGELDDDLAAIYDLVLRAQETALGAVRAGPTGREVDAVARDLIAAEGHGEHFGHGLGHGVGLEVHEAPRLSRESTDTLAAGNVVTVEPGVYLEGLGGIRIEDLVIVTENGADVLTSSTKDPVTVS